MIVKPNFEGSSQGHHPGLGRGDAWHELQAKVAAALAQLPGRRAGRGVHRRARPRPSRSWPAVDNDYDGVLAPVEYVIDPELDRERRYRDLRLRAEDEATTAAVTVRAPAQIPREICRRAARARRRRSSGCSTAATSAASTSGCRDAGRPVLPRDQRAAVAGAGRRHLRRRRARGAALRRRDRLGHRRARRGATGSRTARAARASRPRKTGPLRVGFTYNVKRIKPTADARGGLARPSTTRPSTLQAIREAIASLGPRGGRSRGDAGAARRCSPSRRSTWSSTSPRASRAETARARCRRCSSCSTSRTPARDPATLSLALDKALAKKIVRQARHPHPELPAHAHRQGAAPQGVRRFPLMVKPVAEGSSKGVVTKSVVQQRGRAARGGAGDGRASTSSRRWSRSTSAAASSPWACSASGGRGCCRRWRSSSSTRRTRRPVYSFQHKLDWNDRIRYDVPAKLDADAAGEAQGGRARRLHGARLPRRGAHRLPHGRAGAGSTSSSATRCPGSRRAGATSCSSPRARGWTTARSSARS